MTTETTAVQNHIDGIKWNISRQVPHFGGCRGLRWNERSSMIGMKPLRLWGFKLNKTDNLQIGFSAQSPAGMECTANIDFLKK